jgi:DNA-binding cell septation regulator SpoVG
MNGIVGFCSFVLNDQIYIGSVAIHNCLKNDLGYRLVYPTRKTSKGDLLSCVYPINRETGDTIERAVIAKYKAIVEAVLINE